MESERIPFAFGKGSSLVQSGIIKEILSGQPGFIYSTTLTLYFLVGGIHGIFSTPGFGKVFTLRREVYKLRSRLVFARSMISVPRP